uniref:WDHD1/CFT4 helical bundle domain-containing protein n=1 Tax=Coccolithus braarudii TaxID=221442 RepID=A0A7S0PV75_9EUKA
MLQLDEFRVSAREQGLEHDEDTQASILKAVQTLDSATLRLVSAACKAERNARALDHAVQLQLPKTLAGALKLANHYKLGPLSDRVTRLLEAKHDQVDIGEDLEQPPPRPKPAARQSAMPTAPQQHHNSTPAASTTPLAPTRATVDDEGDGGGGADDDDDETDQAVPAPSAPPPVRNPFAKTSSGGAHKDVLDVGATTPGTAKGIKRKGILGNGGADKRVK